MNAVKTGVLSECVVRKEKLERNWKSTYMKSTRLALTDRPKSVDRGNLRGCIRPPALHKLSFPWRPRWMRLEIVR